MPVNEKPAANNSAAAQPPKWTPPTMEEMLDMEVEAWRPEVGDVLIGRVLRITEGGTESAFGSYPIIMIQADRDGMCINVHAFHRVLRRELARQEVGEGDRVGVKYLGTVKGGDFGKFENYRVIKDHAVMESAPPTRAVVKDSTAPAGVQAQAEAVHARATTTEDEIPF